MPLKKIDEIGIEKYLDSKNFGYQKNLTQSLDALDQDFNQDIINQIVLWKVNRYAFLDRNTLDILNKISRRDSKLDERLTKELIQKLIGISGIRLPMASTILRFKNPNIYQIIDQRVFRMIYGHKYKLSSNKSKQADLYIEYLHELKLKCSEKNIPFQNADRILYLADKEENKAHKLAGY